MSKIRQLFPALLCCLFSFVLRAEVVTDGALGPAGHLPGPDFRITSDLGRQAGHNLFHSFSRFNIGQQESATFSGPGDIRNVIGRVTGGQSSHIDGTLRSTIPGADLFLLNPSGVLIGEHASLDVGGSLFVSSADHLEFSDGSRFSATDIEGSVLSVAAPSRFGFVSDAPAPIRLEGAELQVNDGRGIALIGGDLSLDGANSSGALLASEGRITLSSVSGPASVALDGEVSVGDAAADRGRIALARGMMLNTSGAGGGRIFIRGGNIVADNAVVLSQSVGASPGKGIHIQGSQAITLDATQVQSVAAGSGDAGPIWLEAPEITLKGRSAVVNSSLGAGRGGTTRINAEQLTLSESGILNESQVAGPGGLIRIEVDDLSLREGAQISGFSTTGSAGGSIEIDAAGRIELSGEPGGDGTFMIYTTALDRGAAGDIRISAGELVIRDALVDASTEGSGAAGRIDLDIDGLVEIRKGAIRVISRADGPAGILRLRTGSLLVTEDGALLALSIGGSGPAGDIEVEAGRIELSDGGKINNEALDSSFSSGDIRVTAMDALSIVGRGEGIPDNPRESVSTGIFSITGDVNVFAPEIMIANSGAISTRTLNNENAGRLTVTGDRITLLDGAQINAGSLGLSGSTGNGGDVQVYASESIRVSGETGGRWSSIQADTLTGGNAGNVDVSAPLVIVENSGSISTKTGFFGEGAAGKITIKADTLIVRNSGSVDSNSAGQSAGGDIEILVAESLELTEGSRLSASSGRSSPIRPAQVRSGRIRILAPEILLRDGEISTLAHGRAGVGGAGEILIETDRIDILEGSSIQSQSETSGGDAGNVTISASRLINADSSLITAAAEQAGGGNILLQGRTIRLRATPVTATVVGRRVTGDGGNVTLDAAAIAATQDSDITARADRGRGGRILVDADVFLRDGTVDLDASSNVAGNEGVVEVNAPEQDLSATIKELPADFLDAAALLRDKCAARSTAERGSLVVTGMDSVPSGPEDYLLSSPEVTEGADPADGLWGAQLAPAPGALLARGCDPLQPVAHQ